MREKMKIDTDESELEELDLEDDREFGIEPEDEFEDRFDEQKPLKTGNMILVFLGLVILAAIICAILWNFTHKDNEDSGSIDSFAEVSREISTDVDVESEESEPAETFEGEEAQQPESTQEASTDATPDPITQEASTDAVPDSITQSVSETAVESASSAEETDLSNRVSTKDGRVIVFTDCDDVVTPKEYVNLRLEPSTSEGNATIHCRLNYGETVHRTGISEDSGWSRVEKDGVVCYVVTSLVFVPEEPQ